MIISNGHNPLIEFRLMNAMKQNFMRERNEIDMWFPFLWAVVKGCQNCCLEIVR